jgi:hypothetical protein
MANHSDFWVTIATVAPVVALSCVVLCSTQGGNLVQLLRERRGPGRAGPRWVIYTLIVAALLNLTAFILETFAFLAALQHFEQNTDGERGLVVFGHM